LERLASDKHSGLLGGEGGEGGGGEEEGELITL
jgi:hypothetical protein